MDLKFKIENEIIGSQSHFTLKISSTSPNDIINVQKIIKNNLKEFAEKTFEDDDEGGIEIEFSEFENNPIEPGIETEILIGQQMAELVNSEESFYCFQEETDEKEISVGQQIADWINNK